MIRSRYCEHYSRLSVMLTVLLLLSHFSYGVSQLTIEDWFFPVSVAPPSENKDNTIYDDEVNSSPEPETINKTNQQIKDYYEKDKWDKWNSQKPILQPVFKQHVTPTNKIEDEFDINKSPRFLPDSGNSIDLTKMRYFPGIQNFIPHILNENIGEDKKSTEPVITMSMTPIDNTIQPEEITMLLATTVSSTTSELATSTTPLTTTATTTRPMKKPYGVARNGEIHADYEFKKMRKDIFRLRNEMNLVKALLNKLYKRSYKKHRDFIPRKMHDSEITSLSAHQTDNDDKWIVIGGKLQRQRN